MSGIAHLFISFRSMTCIFFLRGNGDWTVQTKKTYSNLVGGFNPSEKYDRQIGSFPQVRDKNDKNSLSCHHLGGSWVSKHLKVGWIQPLNKNPTERHFRHCGCVDCGLEDRNGWNPLRLEKPWKNHGKVWGWWFRLKSSVINIGELIIWSFLEKMEQNFSGSHSMIGS